MTYKKGDLVYFNGIDSALRPHCNAASYQPLVGLAVFRVERVTDSAGGQYECTLLNLPECLTACGLAIGKQWYLHESELCEHDNLFSMPNALNVKGKQG